MLTNISRDIIENAQHAYLRDFIWLEDARLDATDRRRPACHGTFRVPPATYTKGPQRYLGCPEAIVCVSHLAYVAWAELLREGLVDVGMTVSQFLGLPPGNMSVFDVRRLRFRRALRKDVPFDGKIVLDSYRPGEMTLVTARFDFGDRAFVGESSFVISAAGACARERDAA